MVGNLAVERLKGFVIKIRAFLALHETFRKWKISNYFCRRSSLVKDLHQPRNNKQFFEGSDVS